MKKLLRTGDKVLLVASVVGDLVFDFAKNSRRARKSGRLELMLGSDDDGAITRTVYRLLKANSLEKIVKNGNPCLRITPSGRGNFCRDFPLFEFQDKPWNGYWCVVNYDIPERRKGVRNSLREKLVALGFGQWKKSTYISPHDFGEDIREWLEERDLESFVSVSESKELADDEKALAREVFGLADLFDNYNDLLRKCEREGGSFVQNYKEYLELLLSDPLLPRELLPSGWPGFKLRKVFSGKKSRTIL